MRQEGPEERDNQMQWENQVIGLSHRNTCSEKIKATVWQWDVQTPRKTNLFTFTAPIFPDHCAMLLNCQETVFGHNLVLQRSLLAGFLFLLQPSHWQISSFFLDKSALFCSLRCFSNERTSGQANKTLWFFVTRSLSAAKVQQ